MGGGEAIRGRSCFLDPFGTTVPKQLPKPLLKLCQRDPKCLIVGFVPTRKDDPYDQERW
jgi:hypothetical protein